MQIVSIMWVPFLNIMALGPPNVPTMVVSLPMAPRLTSSRTCIHMGMKRREWSTVITTPFSSQAAMSLSASSRLVASGFSQKMPFTPASAASTPSMAWVWSPVAMVSMSRSDSRSISLKSV